MKNGVPTQGLSWRLENDKSQAKAAERWAGIKRFELFRGSKEKEGILVSRMEARPPYSSPTFIVKSAQDPLCFPVLFLQGTRTSGMLPWPFRF